MSTRLPGTISRIEVNPLLTAGITSVRKPVVFGVGDTKVLVENEKLIRGTGDTDSVVNTVYGSTTTITLANIIRVGDAPTSADYTKTTDYVIDASGDVDWSTAATEPTSGSEYYVSYYKSIASFDLTEYVSEGDIKSTHGGTYFAATRQFATVTLPSSASATDTFTWSNDEAIDTPADWTITFISGPNTNVTRAVSAYSVGEFTVSPAFVNDISVDDIFLIENTTPTVNMLTAGGVLALRNGSQSVKVGQLDNGSFVDALAPTNAEYSTALNTHLTAFTSDVEFPYFVVPMLPDNSTTFVDNTSAQGSAINPVWNHAKLMSAPENKGERTCVAGFLSGTSVDTLKSYGASYFNTRMIAMAPGDVEFNDASGKTINGSLAAAAWAGKYCSKLDFTSLLNEALVGITISANFYNAVQQRDLTGQGVTFIISDAGVTKVVASKTTDVTSADTEDVAIVSIADDLSKTTREELTATFTGTPINENLLGAVGGKMSSIFEDKITQQVITAYESASITVRQNTSEPRLIEVTASVSPQYSNWWTDVTIAFFV